MLLRLLTPELEVVNRHATFSLQNLTGRDDGSDSINILNNRPRFAMAQIAVTNHDMKGIVTNRKIQLDIYHPDLASEGVKIVRLNNLYPSTRQLFPKTDPQLQLNLG